MLTQSRAGRHPACICLDSGLVPRRGFSTPVTAMPRMELPAVARSWDDLEMLMYADEPANFILEDDCAAALCPSFKFPP